MSAEDSIEYLDWLRAEEFSASALGEEIEELDRELDAQIHLRMRDTHEPEETYRLGFQEHPVFSHMILMHMRNSGVNLIVTATTHRMSRFLYAPRERQIRAYGQAILGVVPGTAQNIAQTKMHMLPPTEQSILAQGVLAETVQLLQSGAMVVERR